MKMENKVISFVPSQDMPRAYRDREEKHFYTGYKVVCISEGEMVELVDARLGATDSCHYAVVWLDCFYSNENFACENGRAYGAGKAGGYGYHRASAALESAFSRAGMRFSVGCSCLGESAMRDCLMCAGEYLKPEGAKIYLVECYG